MTGPAPAAIGTLRSVAWTRILASARRRLERAGGELSGTITLADPDEDERRLIIGLTGVHRPPGVRAVRIGLRQLDAAVAAETGLSLVDALAVLDGPVRNRPAERSAEVRARDEAVANAAARAGSHADRPWFLGWLDELTRDGTLTRLVRRGDGDQLGWACTVLAALPIPAGQPLSLPVLAERTTGNTKALSGTAISTLVLRALARSAGAPPPVTAAQRRQRWAAAGVIVDDLASQVLVLGLRPPQDNVVAGWLRTASAAGIPFRLTLHQLTIDPITLDAPDVYVCENPAVLRAAATEWHDRRPPLICTEGQPSAACHRVLAGASGTVHWRGDFDWTGLRTTAAAARQHGALPWRMSTGDYLQAIDAPLADTEPLKGAPAPSPWEPALAGVMATRGRAVMEERLIPLLLADL